MPHPVCSLCCHPRRAEIDADLLGSGLSTTPLPKIRRAADHVRPAPAPAHQAGRAGRSGSECVAGHEPRRWRRAAETVGRCHQYRCALCRCRFASLMPSAPSLSVPVAPPDLGAIIRPANAQCLVAALDPAFAADPTRCAVVVPYSFGSETMTVAHVKQLLVGHSSIELAKQFAGFIAEARARSARRGCRSVRASTARKSGPSLIAWSSSAWAGCATPAA
jgi:hypothetical protein